MERLNGLRSAQRLAVIVPATLLAGAYLSQYVGGLQPCEMCWWQRYAHFAALALGLVGLAAGERRAARLVVLLAAVAILVAGALGLFHAGVENHWWTGLTRCSVSAHGRDMLAAIYATPLVRCDEAQWRLLGISLAGWNAIISIPVGLWISWQTLTHRR